MRAQLPPSLRERYHVEADLSGGAQADVVHCRERSSGLEVAIKIYRRGVAEPDTELMTSLTSADPRHVVPSRLERDKDAVWEVMEYLPLGSLDDLVTRRGGGAQPPELVRAVLEEVGTALDHVHGHDIVHRDLKPQNILVRAEDPLDCVLADFGLARANVMSNAIGSVAGTYPYTSPEGSFGRGNKANDWWGLGVIVHELLTGRHLFAADGGGFLTENRVRAAYFEHSWTYDDVTDPRWRLLLDGLLAPAAGRWTWAQVNSWLAGGSPATTAWPQAAPMRPGSARSRQATYHFAGVDHATPPSLAAAIRSDFDRASSHLAGVKVVDLMAWLHGTEVDDQADDLLAAARSGRTTPGRVAVELQLLLDPEADPIYRTRELSAAGFTEAIDLARGGDAAAASWIRDVRSFSLLSLLGRYAENSSLSRADELLDVWWGRMEPLKDSPPWRVAGVAELRPSDHVLEGFLFGAALSAATAASTLRDAAARIRELPADAPEALRAIRVFERADAPGFADAVLGVLTIPAWLAERRHQQEERDRAEAARRAEEERQRKIQQRQQSEQRRAEARQARERAASRRRSTDLGILVTAFVLCVTVLVPWLLGRYALRGRLFRSDLSGLFDPEVRDTGAYFLTDWTAGCVVILVGAAVLVVVRPWWHRAVSLVFAGIFGVGAVVGLAPYSQREWTAQERVSVATLRSTDYPFADRYYTCGGARVTYGTSKVLPGEPGVVYTLFTAQVAGSNANGCDRVVFYQGWRRVRSIDLKKGQVTENSTSPVTVSKKKKPGNTVFTVRLGSGKTLKYKVSDLLR